MMRPGDDPKLAPEEEQALLARQAKADQAEELQTQHGRKENRRQAHA